MNEELEQIRRENDELRKQVEAIELAREKAKNIEMQAKVEEQKKLDLQKHDDELIAKVKAELGVNNKSKINDNTTRTSMNLQRDNEHIEFGRSFIERRRNQGLKMEGLPYEKLLEKLAYKEYAKVI